MEIGPLPPEKQLTTDNKVTIRECEETITTIEIVDAYKLVQNNVSTTSQSIQEIPKTSRLFTVLWAPWQALKSFLVSNADERCWCETEPAESPQSLSVVSGQVVSGDDPSLVFTIRTPMRVRHVALDNQSYIDSLNRLLSRKHGTKRDDFTFPESATNNVIDQTVTDRLVTDQNVTDQNVPEPNVTNQNLIDQTRREADRPSKVKVVEPNPAVPSPTGDPQNPTDQLPLPSRQKVASGDRNSTSGTTSAVATSEAGSGQWSGVRSRRKPDRVHSRDVNSHQDSSYLTIRIGDEKFQVERSALVAKSDLLDRLHSTGYLERGKICIQGIEAPVFWTLVRYILTDEINLNQENYRAIRACAKKLEIKDLLDKCSEFRGRHRKSKFRNGSGRLVVSCLCQAEPETGVVVGSKGHHPRQSTATSPKCLRFFVNADRSLRTESWTTGSLETLSNYDTIRI